MSRDEGLHVLEPWRCSRVKRRRVPIPTRSGLPPCYWSLPVDDWGHDDGGLSSEARGRFIVRGPLVFRACLVGLHTPWAPKEEEDFQQPEHLTASHTPYIRSYRRGAPVGTLPGR